MEDQIRDQSGETSIAPPMIDSFGKKLLFGALVIAAPLFNFNFINLLEPEWQDGKFSSYIKLFLLPEASLLFFPLLAYAVTSYILLLWDMDRYARSFAIRMGIYTGVVLALQYSLLTLLAIEEQPNFYVLLVYISPFILLKIYRWLTSKWKASLMNPILIGLGIVTLIAGMMFMDSPMSPFVLILMFVGVSAAFWSFLIALQAARWLWTNNESKLTLPRGLGIFAWVSAYAFALRFNILKMFELYNAMPTEPPNCYIATAAAKGHPGFVGSQEVTLANGTSMRVNRQLQRLKAVEIGLLAIAPNIHKFIRVFYNKVGKRLAAQIQNPFSADVTFIVLILPEFISFFALKLIVPEISFFANSLYVE